MYETWGITLHAIPLSTTTTSHATYRVSGSNEPIMPKSRYTNCPVLETRRLPGCGSCTLQSSWATRKSKPCRCTVPQLTNTPHITRRFHATHSPHIPQSTNTAERGNGESVRVTHRMKEALIQHLI